MMDPVGGDQRGEFKIKSIFSTFKSEMLYGITELTKLGGNMLFSNFF